MTATHKGVCTTRAELNPALLSPKLRGDESRMNGKHFLEPCGNFRPSSAAALRARRKRFALAHLLFLCAISAASCARAPVEESTRPEPSPSTLQTPVVEASPATEPLSAHDANQLKQYTIKSDALPPPQSTDDAQNPPLVIAQPSGARLYLPPGFEIKTFAAGGFELPRWMALAPNGDVFVADAGANSIIVLRDTKGQGVADSRYTFATGLNKPFGMAFWREYLYVGNTDAVVRFSYKAGQTQATDAPEKIADLPGHGYREHWTRNIIFNPKGTKMYVTVGSASNEDVEPEPRACILEFNPDGTGRRVFASGMRNPIGLAFSPSTNSLWAAVQERDHFGDDLPPDYVTEVKDGGFYSWPYAYAGQNVAPRYKEEQPELVKKSITPDVLIQAHSAVLGLAFYSGKMFPEEYRGDAFVALHGSWNRSKRTGYKIVRIRFRNGRPAGSYEDFVSGWMLDENKMEVWGRPVGLLVLPDGSLLVSDDGAKKIWRITYQKSN
jgi:glucose/arabinose dehydrogenase